jgi:hypothetical protein
LTESLRWKRFLRLRLFPEPLDSRLAMVAAWERREEVSELGW